MIGRIRIGCFLTELCSGPSEAGGLGGFSPPPPENLLKFVDFVSEKGCKSQGCRNEDSKTYIRGSYQNLSKIQNERFLASYKSRMSKFSGKDSH